MVNATNLFDWETTGLPVFHGVDPSKKRCHARSGSKSFNVKNPQNNSVKKSWSIFSGYAQYDIILSYMYIHIYIYIYDYMRWWDYICIKKTSKKHQPTPLGRQLLEVSDMLTEVSDSTCESSWTAAMPGGSPVLFGRSSSAKTVEWNIPSCND